MCREGVSTEHRWDGRTGRNLLTQEEWCAWGVPLYKEGASRAHTVADPLSPQVMPFRVLRSGGMCREGSQG